MQRFQVAVTIELGGDDFERVVFLVRANDKPAAEREVVRAMRQLGYHDYDYSLTVRRWRSQD